MTPPRSSAASPSGLIVVDKPIGMSSMDVVRHVRRAAGGTRTGHAGTLDPLATGVVICCLGKATRSVDQLMGLTKIYETTIDLSAFTNTDDMEGEREEVVVPTPPTLAAVLAVCNRFVGRIEQVPPAYSAIHVNGQRAYKLARRGEAPQLASRAIDIYAIDLLSYTWPMLGLRVTCGKGVYIRSLARDLGKALGTGGHLAMLRRTAIGPYTLEQAASINRFQQPVTQDDLLPPPDSPDPRSKT